MKRADLAKIVAAVEPALAAASNPLPALQTLWFTEEGYVQAYDDEIALARSCEGWGFVGGVHGASFVRWLKDARGPDVEHKVKGDQVTFTCGRSRAVFKVVPIADSPFQWPEDECSELEGESLAGFLGALRQVAVGMDDDAVIPWRMGVTLRFAEGSSRLYSHDNCTLSVSTFSPWPEGLEGWECSIPPRFVRALLALAGSETVEVVEFADGWVKAATEDDTYLLSKLGAEVRAAQFVEIEDRVRAKLDGSTPVEIPEELSGALRAAVNQTKFAPSEICTLRIAKGEAEILFSTSWGDVREEVAFEGHADAEIHTIPSLVLRAIELTDHVTVIPGEVIELSAGEFRYYVAAQGEEVPEPEAVGVGETEGGEADGESQDT